MHTGTSRATCAHNFAHTRGGTRTQAQASEPRARKQNRHYLVSDAADPRQTSAGHAPHGGGDEVVVNRHPIRGGPRVVQGPLVRPDAVRVISPAKLGSIARVEDGDHVDVPIPVLVKVSVSGWMGCAAVGSMGGVSMVSRPNGYCWRCGRVVGVGMGKNICRCWRGVVRA